MISSSNQTSGFWGILRDSNGDILLSMCIPQSIMQRPEVMEALSLWRMMEICDKLKIENVIFKGDCLAVVKAVAMKEGSMA